MPVLALPPSSTKRWWLVYTVNGSTHRMMARTAAGVDAAGANSTFNAFLNNIAASSNAIRPQTLEFAAAGTDVRTLAGWTGAPSYGTGDNTVDDRRARTVSFVGRTPGGHKTRVTVFGIKDIAEPDYRVDTTESAVIAATVAFLNGAIDVFIGIDGARPVWHLYGNINFNDHWIKAFRRAGG